MRPKKFLKVASGYTALCWASWNGCSESTTLLLEAGEASRNSRSISWRTRDIVGIIKVHVASFLITVYGSLVLKSLLRTGGIQWLLANMFSVHAVEDLNLKP